ncbi:MAG: CFI-box-CTERM domain-containing protein [Candidatus Bathyarchaeia archaeon]
MLNFGFSKQNCTLRLSILSFFLLTVLLFVSISGFIGYAAGTNYASRVSVSTYWPDRVLDPGQSTTAKVIVRQSITDAFLEPTMYLAVNTITLRVVSSEAGGDIVAISSKPRGEETLNVELVGEFPVPLTISSTAKSGRYNFLTTVGVAVINITDKGGSQWLLWDGEVKDEGSIWIGGEEEKTVTESTMGVSVTLKAAFPTTAEAGETITGKATIIPDATIQTFGGTFTVDASQISFPGLGISKEIAPAGTSFKGAKTFPVTVAVPKDAEEGEYSWTASATGTGKAMFMSEQRTVVVDGSLNVIRPFTETELECIIATAAFGSRMDTNVEAMRNLRDNSVKITFTGDNFMHIFNAWYYSWSPSMAKIINNNQDLRQITRFVLYPVVGSVMAAQSTESIFSFNRELAATSSILTAAFICGIFYFAPLILIIRLIKDRLGRIKSVYCLKNQNIMLLVCGVLSGLLTIIGVVSNSAVMNTVGVTMLALTVTLSAAAITVKALTKINGLMKTTLTK